MLDIPPGATTEQILELMRKAGLTADTQVQQQTPSGGTVTQPTMFPGIADSLASAAGQTGQGATAPSTGPRFYTTPQSPTESGGGGGASDFNMSDFLGSKFGASAPQTRSIQTNTQTFPGNGFSPGDYASITKALQAGYQAPMDQLNKFGAGERATLAQNYKNDVGQQEQDAVSRGLDNSTIRTSMLGGARTREQNATLNLNDMLAQQKAGLLERQMPSSMQSAQLLSQAMGSGGNPASIRMALGLR